MYDHILVPVDGSDEATAAARRGLALAKDFDATAEAVYVVEQRALALTEQTARAPVSGNTASQSSRRSSHSPPTLVSPSRRNC